MAGTYKDPSTNVQTTPVIKGDQIALPAAILSGQTISDVVDLGVRRAVGLSMPSGFTGTTVTFQSSLDGVTFVPVYKDGAQVSEQVGTSRRIVLDPGKFYGIRFLKIASGSAEGADRVINVVAEG